MGRAGHQNRAARRELGKQIWGGLGFIAGFHLEDTDTGLAYSLTVFKDATAAAAARDALAARPTDKRVGVDPDTVQFLTAREF